MLARSLIFAGALTIVGELVNALASSWSLTIVVGMFLIRLITLYWLSWHTAQETEREMLDLHEDILEDEQRRRRAAAQHQFVRR